MTLARINRQRKRMLIYVLHIIYQNKCFLNISWLLSFFCSFLQCFFFLSLSLRDRGAGEGGRAQAVTAARGRLRVRGRCGSSVAKLLERKRIREAGFLLAQDHRQENVPQWVSTDAAFQFWIKKNNNKKRRNIWNVITLSNRMQSVPFRAGWWISFQPEMEIVRWNGDREAFQVNRLGPLFECFMKNCMMLGQIFSTQVFRSLNESDVLFLNLTRFTCYILIGFYIYEAKQANCTSYVYCTTVPEALRLPSKLYFPL